MKTRDLKNFQKKIIIRQLKIEDYEDLVAIEHKCFPGMKPWRRDHIESHLNIFPEGQIVVEINGKLVASSSSLIIDLDEYNESHSWRDVSGEGYIKNHDPQGGTLYGLEIMVDPDYRGMRLARRLYEARKDLCRKLNLRRMIIGGRIPNFQKYLDKLSAREYVEQVLRKKIHDPVLTTQLSNDFVLKRLMKDYLKTDEESAGWATMLEWTNIDYQPKQQKTAATGNSVRLCTVQYQMRHINSFEEFAKQVEYFVDVAAGYKCDFLLFPEMLTHQLLSFIEKKRPGEAVRELSKYTDQYLNTFTKFAISYNINILGGSHFTEENGSLYNIAYLFQRNGQINKQYKLHITPSERKWWGVEPGGGVEVFDTDKGKVSIQICYDVEFPELSRMAVEKGARLILVPFCTDERHGYLRVRYCAQARCIENQVYAAISGNVGNLPFVENMDVHYAQSGIYTPLDFPFARDGIAAECTPNIETVVIQDVDFELLEKNRREGTVRNWMDRRLDLYKFG